MSHVRALFTSELGEPRALDRWDGFAALAGVLIGGSTFAILVWQFYDLAFSSDLFVTVQLARSGFEGHPLRDNCVGNHLILHTYFFTLVLGILAKPLGAPGLFVALGLALAASVYLAARILRLLGATGPEALLAACLLLVAPISVVTFQEPGDFGFHIELMLPFLALGLFYQLLRKRWWSSLAMALVVCSVKEDAPIAVMCVAALVVIDEWLSHRRWHRPALAVFALALVTLPLLLRVGQLFPPEPYAVNRFSVLAGSTAGKIRDVRSLLSFATQNLGNWLKLALDQQLVRLFLIGTFGLLVLRPWALPVLFGTSVVAWVLNQVVIWAPRFANTLAGLFCVALLGAASLLRARRSTTGTARHILTFAGALLVLLALGDQVRLLPWSLDTYRLKNKSPYTAQERAQANALFAVYRRQGRPEEPVVASPHLFRYAHDRNLFWLDRLAGRPQPVWILGDGQWEFTGFGLKASEYPLVGKLGRFTLRKRLQPGSAGTLMVPGPS